MRVRYIHSVCIVMLAASSACGGTVGEEASSETVRQQVEREGTQRHKDDESDAGALALTVESSDAADAAVALAATERFRRAVESIRFVPVSEPGAHSAITVPETEAARGTHLRGELPHPGVYDIAIYLADSNVTDSAMERSVLSDLEFSAGDLSEVDGESDGEEQGDPVPFPADNTSWELSSAESDETADNGDPVPLPTEPQSAESTSSDGEGERADNGDPVPLPTEPVADQSESAGGETADNGDPVPLPTDPLESRQGESLPGDEEDEGGANPDPKVFETGEGLLVVIPNVDLSPGRVAGLQSVRTPPKNMWRQ